MIGPPCGADLAPSLVFLCRLLNVNTSASSLKARDKECEQPVLVSSHRGFSLLHIYLFSFLCSKEYTTLSRQAATPAQEALKRRGRETLGFLDEIRLA